MKHFPLLPKHKYHTLRQEIRSGDILLCSGHSAFSTLIKNATGSIWSHVGFILRLDAIDRIMVLECVESIGVRAIPLRNYISNYNGTGMGYNGDVMVARHQDVRNDNVTALSKRAVDLLGYPYGMEEIVRIAARIGIYSLGIKNTTPDSLPEREFICSEYAYVCYKEIGIDFKYNDMGFIAPVDFATHPKVQHICYMEVETSMKSFAEQQVAYK